MHVKEVYYIENDVIHFGHLPYIDISSKSMYYNGKGYRTLTIRLTEEKACTQRTALISDTNRT